MRTTHVISSGFPHDGSPFSVVIAHMMPSAKPLEGFWKAPYVGKYESAWSMCPTRISCVSSLSGRGAAIRTHTARPDAPESGSSHCMLLDSLRR